MKTVCEFALFDTRIGECGLVWSEAGIRSLHLPDASPPETRARIRSRHPEAVETDPPEEVRAAIDAVRRLLGGQPVDLSAIHLDTRGLSDFQRRVYAFTRTVLPGSTTTYGEVARAVDQPGSARAVGRAMGANPFPLIVPCHRVLSAGGRPGGFSAPGGVATKLDLLAVEGRQRSLLP